MYRGDKHGPNRNDDQAQEPIVAQNALRPQRAGTLVRVGTHNHIPTAPAILTD
jgi:hypothetical protein